MLDVVESMEQEVEGRRNFQMMFSEGDDVVLDVGEEGGGSSYEEL